jgi:hypothetical protein
VIPAGAPKPTTPPFLLSELDDVLIRTVAFYEFITVKELARLQEFGSLSALRQRLRRLSGADQVEDKRSDGDHVPGQYLFRFSLPVAGKGTKPRVYCLGVKGRQYLGVDGYFRPAKILGLSYLTLWHALTLTRCCVCAGLLAPAFTLSELRLSYQLAFDPPRVTLGREGEKKAVAVIPDAFLWFVRSDGEALPVLLEVDRGTMQSRRRVKAALQARIEMIKSGEYARYFGTAAVRLAYLTTAGEGRRDALERWACEVISEVIAEEKHREGWLEKFFFIAWDYDELFDKALWTDPLWQCPASANTVPLLPPIPANKTETHDGDIAQTTGTGEVTAALCDQTGLSADAAE